MYSESYNLWSINITWQSLSDGSHVEHSRREGVFEANSIIATASANGQMFNNRWMFGSKDPGFLLRAVLVNVPVSKNVTPIK